MTEDAIELFVRAFYEKIRHDPALAPIFTAALGSRWDAHLRRMCSFWRSAMRISPRYKGDMLAAHRRLGPLSPVLFERWLELFEETAKEHFAEEPAEALCDRARKTARNLESALSHPVGALLETPKGSSRAIHSSRA
jgi:hemoglobin